MEQLAALHRVGIDGVQLSFYDFKLDLEYFGEKILPLLEKAGLRVKVDATSGSPSRKRSAAYDLEESDGIEPVTKKR